MSFLQSALDLAQQGFYVFPIVPNSKIPEIDDYPNQATRDATTIKSWWTCDILKLEQPFNIGIYTGKYQDNQALIVIDVDMKGDTDGNSSLSALKKEGKELPGTYTQFTPSGGMHLVFSTAFARKQGVSVLGKGLDIRSSGGYILGRGSVVGTEYEYLGQSPQPAPAWLEDALPLAEKKSISKKLMAETHEETSEATLNRAIDYLKDSADLAIQGSNGDHTTFSVACRVKDMGLSRLMCHRIMLAHWNDRCEPPWEPEQLADKVDNAYNYGVNPPGYSSPQSQFTPIENDRPLDDIDLINKEYAFILVGGNRHILWETKDYNNAFMVQHLSMEAFHDKLAARTVLVNDKRKPLSKVWLTSPKRRSYDGILFAPGEKISDNYYNLWHGFAVEPCASAHAASKQSRDSFDKFLEHTLVNVCGKDEGLFQWLIGYFAHIFQHPGEKPGVGLVFRGGKGVGKNALVDRIGYLLGCHYRITASRRYLTGNFNSHLENCLLFALDEAFWSGDHQAEGTLKDLITGQTHIIEHKGKEPYPVKNCTRVVIIGNERWLVPATQDERRFAVFDVGSGRKQDRHFFKSMRVGLENGGYAVLLRYLLDYDLSKIEVDEAPKTTALMDQKISSLNTVHKWWFDCLQSGTIEGSDLGDSWPEKIELDKLRQAYKRHVEDTSERFQIPGTRVFRQKLYDLLPRNEYVKRIRVDDQRHYFLMLPPKDRARRMWDAFIEHKGVWDDE
jgi:hypothetical protein